MAADGRTEIPRPSLDPELAALVAVLPEMAVMSITPEMIAPTGGPRAAIAPPIEELFAGRDLTHEERHVPGPDGAPDVLLSIFRRADHVDGGPGIYNIHGGGMIGGDRFLALGPMLNWVDEFDAVLVSVEYRLALQ